MEHVIRDFVRDVVTFTTLFDVRTQARHKGATR